MGNKNLEWQSHVPRLIKIKNMMLLVVCSAHILKPMGCDQPGLVGGIPTYSREWELDQLEDPFQPKSLYDPTKTICM